LPERLSELDREQLTIVHCHSGQRSAQAVRILHEAGFANVFNLEGGIARWSDEIDSDVPSY
jgi:sulfur-carrier protein adenylyltransferase/sulfurtransferase